LGNFKLGNYEQSFDKIQQDLFQRHQVNTSQMQNHPSESTLNKDKIPSHLINVNNAHVKVQPASGMIGIKSVKRQQKALTRPASN
jgi:hypothetical protein